MIEASRIGVRESIENDISDFSNDTLWGPKPNRAVIRLGRKFCDETLEHVDTINDMNVIQHLAFFSKIVLVLVASTRHYEEIDDEELTAIGNILDDLRVLRADIISGSDFERIYLCAMYVRDIICTNTYYREDSDGLYRQNMIFPNFCDLYDIVHKIVNNWDKLDAADDFSNLFTIFKNDWYRREISADGDMVYEAIHGKSGHKPDTARQGEDPGFWARRYVKMLDERINN